ncbi:MAG: response regulator [Pseudobdellovibrio sp.]
MAALSNYIDEQSLKDNNIEVLYPKKHTASSYKKKILIIEDDKDMADIILLLLNQKNPNIECTVVEDPYEAILALADNKFDYVLVDQRLPGLTGSSVLREVDHYVDQDPVIIESGHYNGSIPVVVMSGSDIPAGALKTDLKHFSIIQFVKKNDIARFISAFPIN